MKVWGQGAGVVAVLARGLLPDCVLTRPSLACAGRDREENLYLCLVLWGCESYHRTPSSWAHLHLRIAQFLHLHNHHIEDKGFNLGILRRHKHSTHSRPYNLLPLDHTRLLLLYNAKYIIGLLSLLTTLGACPSEFLVAINIKSPFSHKERGEYFYLLLYFHKLYLIQNFSFHSSILRAFTSPTVFIVFFMEFSHYLSVAYFTAHVLLKNSSKWNFCE